MSQHSPLVIKPAKKNGYCFLWGSKKLSSQYDSIKESQSLIQDYQEIIQTTKEVIFIGYFPIYHISILKDKNPNLNFSVLEDFNIKIEDLQNAWEVIGKDNPHHCNFDKLNFFTTAEELINYLETLSIEHLKNILFIPSPYSHPALVLKIKKKHLEIIGGKKTESHTINYFQSLWQIHTLYNLKHHAKNFISSIQLSVTNKKKQVNRPVLLISSGPELDLVLQQHSKELAIISHNFSIVAVPGIAKRLLDNAVKLSALITTDAGFANTYHLKKIYPEHKNIPLITPLSIHPCISRNWEKIFFYWDLIEHKNLLQPCLGMKNFIPADASVVLSAVRYLSQQGFNQIFTIGIDFAITPFQEHACSNTTQEILFNRNTRLQNYTTAIHNLYHHQSKSLITNKVKQELPKIQNRVLLLYKNQFQKTKNNLQKIGTKVINVKEFPWKEYVNKPSHCQLLFQSNQKSRKNVYSKIKDDFKKQNFLLSFQNQFNPHTPKQSWFLQRWNKL